MPRHNARRIVSRRPAGNDPRMIDVGIRRTCRLTHALHFVAVPAHLPRLSLPNTARHAQPPGQARRDRSQPRNCVLRPPTLLSGHQTGGRSCLPEPLLPSNHPGGCRTVRCRAIAIGLRSRNVELLGVFVHHAVSGKSLGQSRHACLQENACAYAGR